MYLSCAQISDRVYDWIGRYKGPKYGHAISMEFALFTTIFMCVLGGGAFLASTLTVEKDRNVRGRDGGGGERESKGERRYLKLI